MSKKIISPRKIRKSPYEIIEPYIFLIPALLIFIVFYYYPFGRTIYLSTWVTDALGQPKKFVGLDNYMIRLFGKDAFWQSILSTMKFVVVVALGGLIIGMITSLLTYNRYPGSGFCAAVYAMPVAIASAAASMAFRMIFHPTGGLLNNLLGTQINWLGGDGSLIKVAVIVMFAWKWVGWNMVIYLAGMQGISNDIYEAAAIDGANHTQIVFRILIPLLKPIILFTLIQSTIGMFNLFTEPFVLTGSSWTGGTNNGGLTLMIYLLNKAPQGGTLYGYASAVAYVITIMIVIISVFLNTVKADKDPMGEGKKKGRRNRA